MPPVFRILCFLLCICHSSFAASGEYPYSPMKPPVPTEGVPWPLPQMLSFGNVNLTLDPKALEMTTDCQCQVVVEALDRYRGILLMERGKSTSDPPSDATNLTRLHVVVDQSGASCATYPYLDMNERYTLVVYENGTAVIQAPAVWGALRALETFSQLTFVSKDQSTPNVLKIRTALVVDWPRFSHRGILLDTARHFLPVKVIKKNLDVMAHAKYNVFHWHIVDDQSFPYVSDAYPELSGRGAYSRKHVYTKKDIEDIVEYARLRGIRVMPEFDSPGHTTSWGRGFPDLLARCYAQGRMTPDYGVVDPSKQSTYDFMLKLLTEVLQRFPDRYVHLGGDEVFFDCWQSNLGVEELMQRLHITAANASKIEDYYIQQLLDLVQQARGNVSYMVWQEVFDNGVKLKPDSVVHVWLGDNQAEIDTELEKITRQNFRTVLSSCWYLSHIQYGNNWESYYTCEPQHFTGTESQKSLVIGGETCMWGEWVDGTNVLQTLWPRASVVAERLWSDVGINDPDRARPRLEEHRCRLMRRGYPAAPVNGPGFCDDEWDE